MASELSPQGELDRQRKLSEFEADPQSTRPFQGWSRNRSAEHPGQASRLAPQAALHLFRNVRCELDYRAEFRGVEAVC